MERVEIEFNKLNTNQISNILERMNIMLERNKSFVSSHKFTIDQKENPVLPKILIIGSQNKELPLDDYFL